MTKTPLISEFLFKQHSPVNYNTDITEFVPYIAIAQELHIKPIIGRPLMEELCEEIATNSLTTANSNLIVNIAPALSFYAVYQALPFHWAAILNKGITIRESENSKSIDIKDIAQLRQWLKDDAETLCNCLIDFLGDQRSVYPLWRPEKGDCQTGKREEGSARKSFTGGFYFPKQ